MVIRLGLAQIDITVGDIDGNVEKVFTYLDLARENDIDILVFPELTITGYPPEDLLLRLDFIKENLKALEKVAAATKGSETLVFLGFVDYDSEIYNSAAILKDGEIKGKYHKMHLPNYSVFDEKRYFAPGNKPILVEHASLKIGVNICEDLWVPAGPIIDQSIAGANLIVNLSASPFSVNKWRSRLNILLTRAMEYSATIAYCNMVGGQDELVFDGRSMLVTPEGKYHIAKAFEEELFVVDVDPSVSTRYNLYEGKRKGYSKVSELETVKLPISVKSAIELTPEVNLYESPREEEAFRALVLGLRDYVRKNGFEKVALGLSGGMDSSLVACIASEALGSDNVIGVLMPSEFTSKESIEDAISLAENLSINTLTIPIKEVYHSYLDALKATFKNTKADVTEENIQARIRGNYLMALSNKFGWLVLATGNKSEIATGYATLYGDMAGGIAVIKDVYKTEVYALANYFNEMKGKEIIPKRVFEKAPSAELKPDQRDQDTLPPYEILDGILQLYIEEGLSQTEIVEHGYDGKVVDLVLKLLRRNEYKRKQGAPGIKISRRAFGKDWRMPITNGYRR
ncbi:NAD synthetase [Kosmotoga arenicorallina S304]|uniref:Glutamine-dependent NAD(+) synthetase n=1 Tax=Kosmotoga arenicorallina S304 TaxID=1453497 RepID=A0A182C708_9BACT|nr:NAD+ synthase [Kosmotoga arenicorallina]OAA31249.1 NAD synthetase [Kosmotoga arenicorallina S304]